MICIGTKSSILILIDANSLKPVNTILLTSMTEPSLIKMTSHRLVSADVTGNIRMWSMGRKGQKIRLLGMFHGHTSQVISCQFDTKQIISSSMNEVRIWDLNSKACIHVLNILGGVIHMSNHYFAVGSISGISHLFTRRGKCLDEIQINCQAIQCIQIIEDLHLVLIGGI